MADLKRWAKAMGYHLTIKRRRPISAEEFAAAVQTRPDMIWNGEEESAAIRAAGSLCATVRLQDGELWTKGADANVVLAMVGLADVLGARAFGDEGEWYSSDGEAHVEEAIERSRLQRLSETKRRRLLWSVARLGLLIVVAYLIYLNRR